MHRLRRSPFGVRLKMASLRWYVRRILNKLGSQTGWLPSLASRMGTKLELVALCHKYKDMAKDLHGVVLIWSLRRRSFKRAWGLLALSVMIKFPHRHQIFVTACLYHKTKEPRGRVFAALEDMARWMATPAGRAAYARWRKLVGGPVRAHGVLGMLNCMGETKTLKEKGSGALHVAGLRKLMG